MKDNNTYIPWILLSLWVWCIMEVSHSTSDQSGILACGNLLLGRKAKGLCNSVGLELDYIH